MSSEYKRLYRSRTDRMVGGVAGGLGEFLSIDSTIMRLIFVFSLFLGGTGLLVYVVMMLVVPEEPLETVSTSGEGAEPAESQPEEKPKKAARKKSKSSE